MKNFLIALTAFLTPSFATAQDWTPDRLYIPLYSKNWYPDQPLGETLVESNENNFPGILASYENRYLGLTYSPGFYRSSNDTMAAVLNVAKRFDMAEDLFWAPTVSLIYELEEPSGEFVDSELNSVLPSLQLAYKNFFMNGLVIQTDGETDGRITFGLTFEL